MVINGINLENCRDDKLLMVMEKVSKLEKYCSLIPGGLNIYVQVYEEYGKMPSQFKEWLKLFNGGFLFSVSIASTLLMYPNRFNHLTTFKEINTEEFKKKNLLLSNYVYFAITNYGNLICYEKNASNEYIYEWDTDEDCIVRQWDSFAEWLDERVLKAETAIEEKLLEPRDVN